MDVKCEKRKSSKKKNNHKEYLMSLVSKAEKLVKRKIRYMVLDEKEKMEFLEEKHKDELLLVWESK